jgi:FkbM family methyltransferase
LVVVLAVGGVAGVGGGGGSPRRVVRSRRPPRADASSSSPFSPSSSGGDPGDAAAAAFRAQGALPAAPPAAWAARKTEVVDFLRSENHRVRVFTHDFAGVPPVQHDFWRWLARTPSWEEATLRIMRHYLRDVRPRAGAVLVDFGAWIGPTVLFGALFADEVLALEPDPLAFEAAVANVALNPELARRVWLFNECIAPQAGNVSMVGRGESSSRIAGLVGAPETDDATPIVPTFVARCRTLPDFLAAARVGAERIALIKMDVEGAEAALLPALAPWLAGLPRRPPIWLSLHRAHYARGEADLRALLDAAAPLYKYAYSETYEILERVDLTGSTDWCYGFCSVLLADEPLTLTSV